MRMNEAWDQSMDLMSVTPFFETTDGLHWAQPYHFYAFLAWGRCVKLDRKYSIEHDMWNETMNYSILLLCYMPNGVYALGS